MKNALRLVAALVVAATAVVAPGLADTGTASAAVPAPVLQVQGNRLVNATTNTTFIPRGVNIPGLEYSCVQNWQKLPAAGEFAAIASWKINTVRLPLNESCWLGLDGAPSKSDGSPGSFTMAQYRASVRSWVDGATAAGLAVILDLHWNAPAGRIAAGQRAMPDERSGAFWTSLATEFAATPSVMFELFNEPYSRSGFTLTWSCWKSGGCQAPVENDETATLSGATYTVTGMQALVTAVRATGATQPILLGGLNYSNDLTGWLANKPTDPLNQLVAAWHNYPGQGCGQTCWNSTITTVAASVPIVTTEFGNTAETTSTAANDSGNYIVPFMQWAEQHGIGYMPWAWWDVSGGGNGVYALYTGSSFTPKAPSGTKFKAHLATIGTPPVEPGEGIPTHDFDGDGKADLLARAANGNLMRYSGDGATGWTGGAVRVGTGWGGFTSLLSPGDANGDGFTDVVARTSNGDLWFYRGVTGGTGYVGTKVGTGWGGFTALVGPGDATGDGIPDIVGRTSTGDLWLYRGTGTGAFTGGVRVGTGWNVFPTIIAPGDFSGDGRADLIGRTSSGDLYLYRGNGAGSFSGNTKIGSGWSSFTAIIGAGDFSGDGNPDLTVRTSSGDLYLYRGNGTGGFSGNVKIASSWNGMLLIP